MAYIDDQSKRINDMYANLKKQKLGELANQNTQVTTDLRRQLADQLPQYQTARAQADVGQVQDFNKLKEYMASNGAFSSGDNLSRASNILTQRTNKVNQINGNENAFTIGMNNKIADANNAYNSNVNAVSSQLDFEKLKQIEDLRERLRQEQLAKEAEDRQYQRQLALSRRSSGGGSSSASQKASKEQTANQVWSVFEQRMRDGMADEFLRDNAEGIISNLGRTEYYKMKDMYEKARYGNGNGRYTQARLSTKKQEETYNKMYEV